MTGDKGKISIDEDSRVPIWLQLRNRIVYLIESGSFHKGEKLPTVRELAVDLEVNYNTVSKVYQDIERDGYIVSKRGKGTFVAYAPRRLNGGVGSAEVLALEFIRQCKELGVPEKDIPELVQKTIDKLNGNGGVNISVMIGGEGGYGGAYGTQDEEDAAATRKCGLPQ